MQQQAQPQVKAQVREQQEAQYAVEQFPQEPLNHQPPASAPEPIRGDYPPYDDVVPYEEAPYEAVPYEEFDMPAAAGASRGDYADQRPAQMQPSAANADVSVAPSNGTAVQAGAAAEAQPDVEALLQAGFGGGVVFSEIED